MPTRSMPWGWERRSNVPTNVPRIFLKRISALGNVGNLGNVFYPLRVCAHTRTHMRPCTRMNIPEKVPLVPNVPQATETPVI